MARDTTHLPQHPRLHLLGGRGQGKQVHVQNAPHGHQVVLAGRKELVLGKDWGEVEVRIGGRVRFSLG